MINILTKIFEEKEVIEESHKRIKRSKNKKPSNQTTFDVFD
jgi:hypothetical protein